MLNLVACPGERISNFTCDDDDNDEEYSFRLKDMPQISLSIALAPVSSIMEPEDSLIMGNEWNFGTIPEMKLDESLRGVRGAFECKGFRMIPSLMSYFPRLVTPLSDSNEDECLAPRDDIELFLHHDPSISIVSILEGFIDEPPLEENDDLFDLESKEND
ncbi:hypothetical protein Tco_1465814 [Tanacetum coccineum]|uniref:Uncharacterized protein n=1 Tax=Tanacetum coccineum TaxID=301880 RepID=A0ABQ4WIR8_9ASTR